MAADQSNPENFIGSRLVQEDPSFADIVEEFVEGIKERLTTMDQAIQAGDYDRLRSAAHQLKGSGGGYGYPTLTERAATLEQTAKNGAMDECVKAFSDLKSLCERVVVSTDTQTS
ncbi:MAG: Hpt domain-containing protein [Phycisphaerae bacterium]